MKRVLFADSRHGNLKNQCKFAKSDQNLIAKLYFCVSREKKVSKGSKVDWSL